MYELSIILVVIGLITLSFSILLILFPSLILKSDEAASRLYLTDSFVMRNRLLVGVFSFFASCLMLYSYFVTNLNLYFLTIGILALVYSVTLVFFPMGLLRVERHANKIYMTDDFFYQNKNIIGGILGFLSFYMIYTFMTLI
tara:strand:- start:967 stop:1392 length:426 start_codon:yes stop_codon:yes gene_type:complete